MEGMGMRGDVMAEEGGGRREEGGGTPLGCSGNFCW